MTTVSGTKNFYAFCDILNGIEIKLCCKLLNVLKTNTAATTAVLSALLSALLSMLKYMELACLYGSLHHKLKIHD